MISSNVKYLDTQKVNHALTYGSISSFIHKHAEKCHHTLITDYFDTILEETGSLDVDFVFWKVTVKA